MSFHLHSCDLINVIDRLILAACSKQGVDSEHFFTSTLDSDARGLHIVPRLLNGISRSDLSSNERLVSPPSGPLRLCIVILSLV